MSWLAIVLALASAATAGVSTSVQHRSAQQVANRTAGGRPGLVPLMRRLVTTPGWLVGQALAVLVLVFHALALRFGPVSLVQPLVISGIVLAVPIRSAMSHRLPPAREMTAVLIAAAGIAAFLIAARPRASTVTGHGAALFWVVLAFTVLGAALVLLGRRVRSGHRRAFCLGIAAGLFFGLVAVTLKATITTLSARGVGGVLASWELYALALVGVAGVSTNQLSYSTGRLSASMPVLNIVDVLLAVMIGFFVFDEVPQHSTTAVVIQLIALVVVAGSLWQLARFKERPDRRGSRDRRTVDLPRVR